MILLFYSFLCTVPQPTVVITRSHSDIVYVGTALTLTADITFSDLSGIDVPLSFDIIWTSDDGVISDDDRITISAVSGSGANYTASLSYSPITIDDGGLVTATLTVRPSDGSQFIQSVTAIAQETVDVEGLYVNITVVI